MRNALILLGALTVGMAFAAPPASAQDYPWCVQGKGVGYPGDCSYRSRAQCLASASGRNVGCGVNPRAAYGQRRNRY